MSIQSCAVSTVWMDFPSHFSLVISKEIQIDSDLLLKLLARPGEVVRSSLCILLVPIMLSSGEVVDDLLSRGVPAISAFVADTTFAVEIEGSLSEGDSLLKHYGGVFFLLADSIAAGWDVIGLQVYVSEATLVFTRADMYMALNQIRDGTPESAVAMWILEQTLVFNR